MQEEQFVEMSEWRYEPPYDFYDGDAEPVLNPERFFAALDDDGELVGHYYFAPHEDVLDYGLGLRPGLVGQGLGRAFFQAGLEFGRDLYARKRVQLHVAAFNRRAIAVYERAGFREASRHVRRFPRFGDVEFITMEDS